MRNSRPSLILKVQSLLTFPTYPHLLCSRLVFTVAVQISFSFFSIEDLIPPLNRLQFDHLGHAACPHTALDVRWELQHPCSPSSPTWHETRRRGSWITSFCYIMKYTSVKMFSEEKLKSGFLKMYFRVSLLQHSNPFICTCRNTFFAPLVHAHAQTS